MSAMDPALEAALQGPNPVVFGAIEIVLSAHTVRVLTGSGVVTFDGKRFTGADATYGTILSVEDLTDGIGDQAPALKVTMVPASTAAATDLASAGMQGAPVSIWLGVVDPASGAVIGEPLLMFLGMLDVPVLKTSRNSYLLELQITSVFEAFFQTDDGTALSDQFHQFLWPGETGLAHVTGIIQHFYWGSSAASGVTAS